MCLGGFALVFVGCYRCLALVGWVGLFLFGV